MESMPLYGGQLAATRKHKKLKQTFQVCFLSDTLIFFSINSFKNGASSSHLWMILKNI